MNVLVISDMHAPFHHKHTLDFLRETYKKYRCTKVVCIGDEVDFHALSFHTSEPESMGAKQEYQEAMKFMSKVYKLFPKVDVCISNHTSLPYRRAGEIGLPQDIFMKGYQEWMQAPKTWRWAPSWLVDNVLYLHGMGYSGKNGALNASIDNECSVVIGHLHSFAGVQWKANDQQKTFGMNVGCVDADTEYLSEYGWHKISEYKVGKVAQYNLDGTAEFVYPQAYIEKPCNEINHVKSKYGLDMQFCDEHRFAYVNTAGNLVVDSGKNVVDRHNKSVNGFIGRIISSFNLKILDKMDLSDDELRLRVAIQADGSLRKNDWVDLTFRKERKIRRLESILESIGIKFKKTTYKDGTTRFTFKLKGAVKEFGKDFYHCSQDQLRLIAYESLLWDGDQKTRYSSTSKKSVDFIQYAFSSIGVRSHVGVVRYENSHRDVYRLTISKTKQHRTMNVNGSNKIEINKVKTTDGKKYCFSVDSGFLVLRRNGCVFITGNCLIDKDSYAMRYGKWYRNKPVIGCGVVFDGRDAKFEPMQLGSKIKRVR